MNAFLWMMKLPAGYWIAAVLLGLAVGLWRRRWTPGLLAAYAFYVFSLAVLSRSSTPESRLMLRLFWSYAAWPNGWEQIVANIAVFVPLGFLLGLLIGWKGVLAGAGFSALIELLQLLLHRGVFEFDDLVHNTLGALIGVALAVLLQRLCKKRRQP
jgi:VanZ family protein